LSNNTAIRIQDISKRYRLGVISTGTLTHDLNRWWHNVRGKADPYEKVGKVNNRKFNGSSDFVWALRNIDLDIKKGEVFGIIGKNGAGKSTLLKILSRVTGPTTGQIKVRGRIGSLLEVGTGFHPELTGKENVFLNGAILGMTKAEIRNKYDEIVEFSGCARYIDTPVKRYSSGMKVRLGFAVAAFLDPEILVVDEVLAVGDAEFQKKAIGKMKDISHSEGRTVIFVSHNMSSIRSLCQKGVVLEDGEVRFTGTAENAVEYYLGIAVQNSNQVLSERTDRQGTGSFRFTDIQFKDINGNIISEVNSGQDLVISMDYEFSDKVVKDKLTVRVSIFSMTGHQIVAFLSEEMGHDFTTLPKKGCIELYIPNLYLRGGDYLIKLDAGEGKGKVKDILDSIEGVAKLTVREGDIWNTGNLNYPGRMAVFPAEFKF